MGEQIKLSEDEQALILKIRGNKQEELVKEFVNNPTLREAALNELQLKQTGGKLLTKSFKIGTSYYEFLLDAVAYKKTAGDVNMTQTKIIHMGLDLVREKMGFVPPRSEKTRKEARDRNAIIKNAIKTTKSKKEGNS